jgi:M6 family metalloprotease-like protein
MQANSQKNHQSVFRFSKLSFSKMVILFFIASASSKLLALSVNPVSGPQKLAIIIVSLSDASANTTTAQANAVIPEIHNYYSEVTNGKITFTGEALGPYMLPLSLSTCNSQNLVTEAFKAADANVNLTNYTRYLIVTPGCINSYGLSSNLSNFNSNDGVISMQGGIIRGMGTKIAIHELGHGFGLAHATALYCSDGSVFKIEGCEVAAYGDPSEPMGSGLGHFTAVNKYRAGWLTDVNIPEVTTPGRYVIEPLAATSNGVKSVKIRMSNRGYLFIEFRQPIGYDASLSSALFQGAFIHALTPDAVAPMHLSFPESTTSSLARSPTLKVGASYTESISGIKITVIGMTSSALTVDVDPGNPDVINPTLSIAEGTSYSLALTSTPLGGQITLHSTISEDRSVYKVVYSMGGQVNDVRSTPFDGTFDSRLFRNGLVGFSANIMDSSGNSTYLATKYLNIYNEPDIEPPNLTLLNLKEGDVLSNTVEISAQASDNVKVKMVNLALDGTQVASMTVSPYVTKLDTKKFTAGKHTITLTAIDYANNQRSVSLNVEFFNDLIAPEISILLPSANTTLKVGATLNISANATDNVGVSKMTLLINGSIISSCTRSNDQLNCSWTMPKSGRGKTFTATVRATDAANNTGSATILMLGTR